MSFACTRSALSEYRWHRRHSLDCSGSISQTMYAHACTCTGHHTCHPTDGVQCCRCLHSLPARPIPMSARPPFFQPASRRGAEWEETRERQMGAGVVTATVTTRVTVMIDIYMRPIGPTESMTGADKRTEGLGLSNRWEHCRPQASTSTQGSERQTRTSKPLNKLRASQRVLLVSRFYRLQPPVSPPRTRTPPAP